MTVVLTASRLLLPQYVGVEQLAVPGTTHDLPVSGLGQELGREDVGAVGGQNLVDFSNKEREEMRTGLVVTLLCLTCRCTGWSGPACGRQSRRGGEFPGCSRREC